MKHIISNHTTSYHITYTITHHITSHHIKSHHLCYNTHIIYYNTTYTVTPHHTTPHAGNRKRIPAPMWLQAGGPKRHSDVQLQSGENLTNLKRKYKQSLCLYCAGTINNSSLLALIYIYSLT